MSNKRGNIKEYKLPPFPIGPGGIIQRCTGCINEECVCYGPKAVEKKKSEAKT